MLYLLCTSSVLSLQHSPCKVLSYFNWVFFVPFSFSLKLKFQIDLGVCECLFIFFIWVCYWCWIILVFGSTNNLNSCVSNFGWVIMLFMFYFGLSKNYSDSNFCCILSHVVINLIFFPSKLILWVSLSEFFWISSVHVWVSHRNQFSGLLWI